MKVACTVRSGGKSALTAVLFMRTVKAADYLSLLQQAGDLAGPPEIHRGDRQRTPGRGGVPGHGLQRRRRWTQQRRLHHRGGWPCGHHRPHPRYHHHRPRDPDSGRIRSGRQPPEHPHQRGPGPNLNFLECQRGWRGAGQGQRRGQDGAAP